jgi:hypothetical protein
MDYKSMGVCMIPSAGGTETIRKKDRLTCHGTGICAYCNGEGCAQCGDSGKCPGCGAASSNPSIEIVADEAACLAIGEWPIDDDGAIPEVQRLQLKPGDTLVFSYAGTMPYAEKERIIKLVERLFPDNRALVLDRGLSLSVLEPTE